MKQTTPVSRRGARILALAGLVALALSAPVATAQTASNPCRANPCRPNPCQKNPCQPVRNPCQANPCAAKARAREIAHVSSLDQLVDEFMATSEATAGRPGGQEPARFPGPEGRPDWFQLLVVTRAENPLLEEECKKQALQLSVDRFAAYRGIEDEAEAVRAAAEHIRMHQDFVHSHGISYADYLREIAECKAFCAPVVASLIQCQVLSVARKPHGIVLFEMDSDAVDVRYEGGSLSNLVSQLDKDASSKVALIGRASRIGDLRYNRRLSARRALAVRDTLIELGVAPERVETMWFGWEPPQLSDWIAGEYGMGDLYASEGPLRMNQSVIAVVY
jgi:outer membrane protein OmpA-like peptidoglycan-associated protein